MWVYVYIYICLCKCVRMCLECVCMSVYMWWWCLGGRGTDKGLFYFVAFSSYSFTQSYPILQVETLNLGEPKEFSPRWHLQTDFITNASLLSWGSLPSGTVRAVVQWVLRLILKQVMCPSWKLWPKYEAETLSRAQRETAIHQEAPQHSLKTCKFQLPCLNFQQPDPLDSAGPVRALLRNTKVGLNWS